MTHFLVLKSYKMIELTGSNSTVLVSQCPELVSRVVPPLQSLPTDFFDAEFLSLIFS
jgi:hypothetical protein